MLRKPEEQIILHKGSSLGHQQKVSYLFIFETGEEDRHDGEKHVEQFIFRKGSQAGINFQTGFHSKMSLEFLEFRRYRGAVIQVVKLCESSHFVHMPNRFVSSPSPQIHPPIGITQKQVRKSLFGAIPRPPIQKNGRPSSMVIKKAETVIPAHKVAEAISILDGLGLRWSGAIRPTEMQYVQQYVLARYPEYSNALV